MSNFGINVDIGAKTTSALTIDSSTLIALAATLPSKAKETDASLLYYESLNQALAANLTEGKVRSALLDIEAQNVNCPILIASALTAAGALDLIKNSKNKLGIRPDLIIATGECAEAGLAAKMAEVSEYLGAMAIFDLQATTETALKAERSLLSSKRLILAYDAGAKVARTTVTATTPTEQPRPLSAFYAGRIAAQDTSVEYGWGYSPSNRVVNGIVQGGAEFEPGQDCLADRLRSNQINSLIRQQGFRTWGDATASSEPIWQDLVRVRIFDKLAYAALAQLFWAIDQNAADALPYVRQAVESFLNNLKGAGIVLGFDVSWDEKLNTKANIAAGKFYLTVDIQDMPRIKRLQINFSYTDSYSNTLIELING